jgi:glyoxylase-like metal-dependent hydrolase (beta-lactamase superfamily II)
MEWNNELALPGGEVAASDRTQGSIFFVGNATVILRYAGFTILTDPNFLHRGDHVHLGYGMVAARRTDPALELEALPPIDFVLLSHMHEDHFDREVERKLDRSLPIVTTPHAAAELASKGFRAAKALNSWEPLTVTKGDARVRVRAMPGAHASGVIAKMLPPVMGSLLEFENSRGQVAFRIYITGDTVFTDDLKEIPRRSRCQASRMKGSPSSRTSGINWKRWVGDPLKCRAARPPAPKWRSCFRPPRWCARPCPKCRAPGGSRTFAIPMS